MNLMRIRKESGMTQREAAEKLGCSINAYGNYERCERYPSIDMLKKMSELFNVSIDYILGNTDYVSRSELPDYINELLDAALDSDERGVKDAVRILKGNKR